MSNLPSIKRFFDEDVKEAPAWFHRFLSQLNLFTNPIYDILNASVDLTANTNEEIYYLQVNNASAIGANNTITFTPKKFSGAPHGINIGQCLINSTTGTSTNNSQSGTSSDVSLSWVWTGSQVQILAIFGLSEGRSHTLTLRLW